MTLAVIKTERDEYAELVIEKLENMLEIARREPQESISIIMVSRGTDLHRCYATPNRVALAGHLTMALANVTRD